MEALDALKRIGEYEVEDIRRPGVSAVFNIKDCPDYETVEDELKIFVALNERFGIDIKILLTALSIGVFYELASGQVVWELPTLHCMTLSPLPGNPVEWCLTTKERPLFFEEFGRNWWLHAPESVRPHQAS